MDTVNVHSLNLGTWSKCLGNIKIELNCLKSFYSYNKDGMGWGRLVVPALFVKLLGTTLTVSLNVMRSIVLLTNFLCSGTSIIVKPFSVS